MTKLAEKIKSIPKTYFYLADIRKISDFSDESLKIMLNRLIKNKELTRITRGVYVSDIDKVDWESLGVEIYSPSYISFEYALAYHNILSQKPFHLTLATAKRSKVIETEKKNLIYRHIQEKMFWGYDKNFIAEPEKAFLDLAYLSLNGYARFDIDEMNLGELNKKKIKEYLKKIDNKRLSKLINSYL